MNADKKHEKAQQKKGKRPASIKMVLTIVVFTAQSVFNFDNWFINIVIVEALTMKHENV